MTPTRPGGLRGLLEDWRFWAVVLAVSVAFRLFALSLLIGRQPVGDPANYVALARNILAGRGIVIDDPANWPNMRASYPPLYPILLAGVGLVAPLDPATFTLLNTMFDIGCAVAIVRLGTASGHADAGRLAAALYLLWPTSLALAPFARKEALLAMLVVVQAVALLQIADRRGSGGILVFGVAAGLAALTQPAVAPLPVLLAVAALPQFESKRRWLRSMAIAALVAALTLTPWWVRNGLLFGRFVPLTLGSGWGFWIGATPAGNGTWIPTPGRFLALDELEASRAMGSEARGVIAAHPGWFLLHCFEKFGRAMIHDDRGAVQLVWANPQAHGAIAMWWGVAATVAHRLALGAALATAIVRRRSVVIGFLAACIAEMLLFGIWFEFDQRHRYFMTPLLLLAASYGGLEFRAWGARNFGPGAGLRSA